MTPWLPRAVSAWLGRPVGENRSNRVPRSDSPGHGGSRGPRPAAAEAQLGPEVPAACGVVWLSLDPRTGEVDLYPPALAAHLEGAYCAEWPTQVSLAGFGGVFEQIVVDVGGRSGRPVQRSTATGGKRDVQRLQVPDGAKEIRIDVIRERVWRIAHFPVPGITEERRVPLAAAAPQGPVDTGRADVGGPGAESEGGSALAKAREERRARRVEAERCRGLGLAALWEWCRLAEAPDLGRVPAEMWGVYSEEHNREIEDAYAQGQPSVILSIGIRTYEVFFEGLSGGRQLDLGLKKRRFVRRRLVTAEERDAVFRTSQESLILEDPSVADRECAICCTTFRETPAIPIVRLPGCGHHFHGACVQHLADTGGTCPCCRAEVDWCVALMPCRPAVPSGSRISLTI